MYGLHSYSTKIQIDIDNTLSGLFISGHLLSADISVYLGAYKRSSLMDVKNNPFEASALTTILVVSDMAKSKSFYVDVLGAKIFREYGGDSLVLEFLGNWILLVTPGGPSNDKPDTHFIAPADKNSVSHSFTIRVKDCTRSYDILKQNGADFITPPIARGAETRCFFHDPDGHLFEISEYKSSLNEPGD